MNTFPSGIMQYKEMAKEMTHALLEITNKY